MSKLEVIKEWTEHNVKVSVFNKYVAWLDEEKTERNKLICLHVLNWS